MNSKKALRLALTLALAGGALLTAACPPPLPPGVVYVRTGPPAPVPEVRVVAPGPGYVWVPGYHRWDGSTYVWVAGAWQRPPRGRGRWVAGHWRHSSRGWYWVDGRWR